MLVLVLAGGVKVGAQRDRTFAHTRITAPFTAAGRKLAVDAATTLLPQYGLAASSTPLLMAGAFPSAAGTEYVIAALIDEPHSRGVVAAWRDIPTAWR